MNVRVIDPPWAVLTESGLGLDAIGSMKGMDLPRNDAENDVDYRVRLTLRLANPIGSGLDENDWSKPRTIDEIRRDLFAGMYFCSTGKWPDTAEPSESKPAPNHVRDAVNANR